MRLLDRYVVRSFLTSAFLWLIVMLSLRIATDLFINMDEFAESDESFAEVSSWIATYYASHSLVYFAELGGVLIVASAAFTIARMNRTNELTAMMASGVSLHRVLLPIILCSVLLSFVIVADRELLIPRYAHLLVRNEDEVLGIEGFSVRFLTDDNRSAWWSVWFRPAEQTMRQPTVLIRDEKYQALGRVTGAKARPGSLDGQKGWVLTGVEGTDAVLATLGKAGRQWYRHPNARVIWTSIGPEHVQPVARRSAPGVEFSIPDSVYGMVIRAKGFRRRPRGAGRLADNVLVSPRFHFSAENGQVLGIFFADSARFGKEPKSNRYCWHLEGGALFYPSDLTPADMKLRQSGRWLEYMSIGQLNDLLQLQRIPDPGHAVLTKHIRIAEPLNNLVMLLVGIPFILSRERNVKASAMFCLLMVGAFYAFIYLTLRNLPAKKMCSLDSILELCKNQVSVYDFQFSHNGKSGNHATLIDSTIEATDDSGMVPFLSYNGRAGQYRAGSPQTRPRGNE